MNGKKPSVYPQGNDDNLMVFKGKVEGPKGRRIDRVVRVVVDRNGNIKKLTTSR